MAWSYEEFDNLMAAYWKASNTRTNNLLKVFFVLFGASIITTALLVTCVIQKPIAIAIFFGAIVSFSILAVYIVATAKIFHKINGVFCMHCGYSLISLNEHLDDLEEDGVELPVTLECPKCKQIVAKKNT
jgi:hypothetical protein